MKTAREEQIQTLRKSAAALRHTVKNTRDKAAEWQGQADKAREKANRDEENARVWELLADALNNGQLDNIVVPLGTARQEPANVRIHALQGRLMAELSDCHLDAWAIQSRKLSAMFHRVHGGSHEAIAIIAERLNIDYSEEPRGEQVFVAASGEIDGIEVEIWSLLPADERPADVEQQGVQTVEHVDYAEAEAVREIEREMAIEAGNDSELDRQVAEDDARNERNAEQPARYTAAQLDGLACNACGCYFEVLETSVPVGTHEGRQLFAHRACAESGS